MPVVLPVVWVLGTSGVGKTTVGERLLSDLADHGVLAAFVDADQLRLATNVPASETQLIAAGLRALMPGFAQAGARVVIVAGLADDREHLAALLPDLPREQILTCHLHAEPAVIRDRIRRRAWLVELTEQAVEYAATIGPDLADLRIDTSALSPDEVSHRLTAAALAHTERASPVPEHHTAEGTAIDTAASVVLVTGPGGAGSSTVGFEIFTLLANAGHSAAYLDAHQLGFVGADPRARQLVRLRARNTRAMIGVLAAHGAQNLVVTSDAATAGTLADTTQRDGLNLTMFALQAAPQTLAARIRRRAQGEGPPIAGDHRRGLSGKALDESISASVNEAGDLDSRLTNAVMLQTDDGAPVEIARSITETIGLAPSGASH